eukprot:1810920-Prymnesium_polylepis.5
MAPTCNEQPEPPAPRNRPRSRFGEPCSPDRTPDHPPSLRALPQFNWPRPGPKLSHSARPRILREYPTVEAESVRGGRAEMALRLGVDELGELVEASLQQSGEALEEAFSTGAGAVDGGTVEELDSAGMRGAALQAGAGACMGARLHV